MKKELQKRDNPYREIKRIVESVSDIKDLATRSRKRHIVDSRYVYYHLCQKYVNQFILADCGSEVDRDHAMVMHGLREFDAVFRQSAFTAYDVYLKSLDILEDDFFFLKNVIAAVKRLEELTNKITVEYELISA